MTCARTWSISSACSSRQNIPLFFRRRLITRRMLLSIAPLPKGRPNLRNVGYRKRPASPCLRSMRSQCGQPRSRRRFRPSPSTPRQRAATDRSATACDAHGTMASVPDRSTPLPPKLGRCGERHGSSPGLRGSVPPPVGQSHDRRQSVPDPWRAVGSKGDTRRPCSP